MKLEGSCHCGNVKFTFQSNTPQPFNRCYCTVCRKMNGGGGYTVNIMGDYNSLDVTGKEHIKEYRHGSNHRGAYEADGLGFSRRSFCSNCATALWNWNPNHAESFYPFASAIDTPLPVPPAHKHIMLAYKAPWVEVPEGENESHYDDYPDGGIEQWHKDRGLWVD